MTHLPAMAELNGLRVHVPPGAIYYREQWVSALPHCARILRILMLRYPFLASMADLIETSSGALSRASVWSQINRLRKALADALVPVTVVNFHGRGYRLEWQS